MDSEWGLSVGSEWGVSACGLKAEWALEGSGWCQRGQSVGGLELCHVRIDCLAQPGGDQGPFLSFWKPIIFNSISTVWSLWAPSLSARRTVLASGH